MNIGIYYHIIEIGVLYERGGMRGNLWRIGERKRLKDECIFWKNTLKYIADEKKGIDCSRKFFDELQTICDKYKLPNYQRVMMLKQKLIETAYSIEIMDAEASNIHHMMKELLCDMENELKKLNGKDNVYRILDVFHNLPKVFHGKDELGEGKPVLYKDALKYASWGMSNQMKEKYGRYINKS